MDLPPGSQGHRISKTEPTTAARPNTSANHTWPKFVTIRTCQPTPPGTCTTVGRPWLPLQLRQSDQIWHVRQATRPDTTTAMVLSQALATVECPSENKTSLQQHNNSGNGTFRGTRKASKKNKEREGDVVPRVRNQQPDEKGSVASRQQPFEASETDDTGSSLNLEHPTPSPVRVPPQACIRIERMPPKEPQPLFQSSCCYQGLEPEWQALGQVPKALCFQRGGAELKELCGAATRRSTTFCQRRDRAMYR